ncbi:antirestriction protein [Vibrio algivorus]|nr:antirestriction protein [Vibrio algivorus]
MLPVEKRADFYPSIALDIVHFEQYVYCLFDRHVKGYQGGYFEFVTCENGAAFAQLQSHQTFLLTNDMNYFQKEVAANVASIAIFALALAHALERAYHLGLKYHQAHFSLLSEKLQEYYRTLDDETVKAIHGFLD